VKAVHGKEWDKLKDHQLVEDYFSAALHALNPELYPEKLSWVESRIGSRFEGKRSADEAVVAIQQMLNQRRPGHTLFLVVDEVSQYVHDDDDRMLALQSFVEALGQRMKGTAWLLATGQQKLEESAGQATAIVKLKDRFPPSLRVHLGVANIRDVVHKRLLRKKKTVESDLRALFEKHRSELALYAYKGDEITDADFVEVYPMLPGHIDLLLDVTTGLRSRSRRTQGDSHAIRGLLQLLGDLFRERKLAQYEVGHLITVDLIFDVLHSALDADVQMTINKGLELAQREGDPLMARVVKAVAMLELAQEALKKVSAELIARCLYQRLGDPNLLPDVQKALDRLAGEGIVAYSEQSGYKIESSAGQEWQKERDAYAPGPEVQSGAIQEALSELIRDTTNAQVEGVGLPWLAFFSDSYGARDVRIRDERKHTVVTVDLQFRKGDGSEAWIDLSDSASHRDRIVWVVGDLDGPRDAARKLLRSQRMVQNYESRQASLGERQRLLMEERNRSDALKIELLDAVRQAFFSGHIYFRGRETQPKDVGTSFAQALTAFGNRVASELYPNPALRAVSEKEILYLIDSPDLSAPPPILGPDQLGILTLDAGRYEPSCTGRVPSALLKYITENAGVTGSTIFALFGAPPHGVSPDVLRASAVGLLRAGKLRIDVPGAGELTSVRDAGAREILKDSVFRKASFFFNAEQTDPRLIVKIAKFFKEAFNVEVPRSEDAIADAVVEHFKRARERLTEIEERFRRLPKSVRYPEGLTKLGKALEACRRSRNVKPTVAAVAQSLPALSDGMLLLRKMESELSDSAAEVLRAAESVLEYRVRSLTALGLTDEEAAAAETVRVHLASEWPWQDTAELAAKVNLLRERYRERRKSVLAVHATRLEELLEQIKRRDGVEKLDADQRQRVLRPLQEAGTAGGGEDDVVPPLETLEAYLAGRRQSAEQKALSELDALLEEIGAGATVEVPLELSGREIRTESELDRLLENLRQRVLAELAANHRVRLK
jgi:hypothetical protein